MLEIAVVLSVLLCVALTVMRRYQIKKREEQQAKQEQMQRISRTIQYCDRLVTQSAFPLPHSMQILLARRKLRCLWAMVDLGQSGLDDSVSTQEKLIQTLSATRDSSTTYCMPPEGERRTAAMQSFFLLKQFIVKDIKTSPSYLHDLIVEKHNIDATILRAQLDQLLAKAESALAKLSLGTARASFEGALTMLRDNPCIADRFAEYKTRAEAGMQSIADTMKTIPELEIAPRGDGLDRMFSHDKRRWA